MAGKFLSKRKISQQDKASLWENSFSAGQKLHNGSKVSQWEKSLLVAGKSFSAGKGFAAGKSFLVRE